MASYLKTANAALFFLRFDRLGFKGPTRLREDPNISEIICDLETVQKWTFIQTETKLEIQEHRTSF